MNLGKKGLLALLLLGMGGFAHASQSEMGEGLTYISDKQADEQAAVAQAQDIQGDYDVATQEVQPRALSVRAQALLDKQRGQLQDLERSEQELQQILADEQAAAARDAALRALDGLARLVDAERQRLMELGLLGRAQETLNKAAQEIKKGYQTVEQSYKNDLEAYYDKQPNPAKARAKAEARKRKIREWKEEAIKAGNQVKEMLGIKSKL